MTGGRNQVFNRRGIARTVEITSANSKHYAMNFGNHFISLYNANEMGAGETGKTGAHGTFDAMSKMPEGYKLAEGQAAAINFTYKANSAAINIYVVSLSEAEKNHASTDDTVVTHVGANTDSPSLNPTKIHLIWKDNKGNIESEEDAPKDYKIDWKSVPATVVIYWTDPDPKDPNKNITTTQEVPVVIHVNEDKPAKHQLVGTQTIIRHVHFVEQGNQSHELATENTQSVTFNVYAYVKDGKPVAGTFVWEPKTRTFSAVPAKNIDGYSVVASSALGIPAENVAPVGSAENMQETISLDTYIYYNQDQAPKPNPQPEPQPDKPKKDNNGGKKDNGNTVKPHATNNNHALKSANKVIKKLPQTGAKRSGVAGVIGAAVAAVAGLFGLAGSRKRRF